MIIWSTYAVECLKRFRAHRMAARRSTGSLRIEIGFYDWPMTFSILLREA
jgi:hypothetical protein